MSQPFDRGFKYTLVKTRGSQLDTRGLNTLVDASNYLISGSNTLVDGPNLLIEGSNALVDGPNQLIECSNSLVFR